MGAGEKFLLKKERKKQIMDFKENILKKIKIDKLAKNIIKSIKYSNDKNKTDKIAMEELLKFSSFSHLLKRDLTLYILEDKVLVIDNELAIYKTDPDDVALRKSPTVKEMVSFKNIKKILNDKDVIFSKGINSVEFVQNQCRSNLDLSYTDKDIEKLSCDASVYIDMDESEKVIESLEIFADILYYDFILNFLPVENHMVFWKIIDSSPGKKLVCPTILYDSFRNNLKLIDKKINISDEEDVKFILTVAKERKKADFYQKEVFDFLKNKVLSKS